MILMNKIPVPAVIAVVVVAILVLLFSMKKGLGVGEPAPPAGPPTAAMAEYSKQRHQEGH